MGQGTFSQVTNISLLFTEQIKKALHKPANINAQGNKYQKPVQYQIAVCSNLYSTLNEGMWKGED